MRIVIDTADLDCERIDGTRVYIQNVLKYMGALSPQDEFFLLHKSRYNKLLKPANFDNYKDKSIGEGLWWTQVKFAREIRKLNPDVCWMPIQQIPFLSFLYNFFNIEARPLCCNKTKYVVTIHDLAFKRGLFSDHFPLIDRIKLNFYTDIAIKKADRIIAISEATKKDIIKLYPKIDAGKILVVYHGFDRENFMQEFSVEEKKEFLEKRRLINSEYLLYVGAIQPRKDLVTLIKSFEQLKNSVSGGYNNLKLVLVGEIAWKSENTLKVVENSEFKEDIIMIGQVGFEELALFFRLAKIFVFPSLYEGFGIPLLEAMASKTPVVVADNSSLREVGGEAVLKFKSRDVEELTKQIKKLLDSDDLQQKMIARGLNRVEEFSWEKCAEKTLEVIKNCK